MFHLYGLIVGIGVVAGWSVAERIEPRVNRVLLSVFLGGIIGARLYHVLDLWTYYSQHLWQILAVWQGGLGIFGGILGGVIVLKWVTKNMEEFWQILAAMIVGLPLAQAIGRWGNLANNELWGRGGEPLFLYESILDLLLFGLLLSLRRASPKMRVAVYLLGYGMIRLLLEPRKVDPWWVGYVVAGTMVSVAIILWYKSSTTKIK